LQLKILVVDDEKNIREGLGQALEYEDYKVELAADGKEAIAIVNQGGVDLVVTDLRMPRMGGEELLASVTSSNPNLPVIVLTGHGTVENAVAAMRNGAYDFLTKPVNLDRLNLLIKRALANRKLSMEHQALKAEVARLGQQKKAAPFIAKSGAMQRIFELAQQVAPTKASVLVTGESGVGKEVVADAIHKLSDRKNKPFVKVHCAALSETLLESELFGHEKGSFTGAVGQKKGRFELADGGTIFLDEIGEINQNVQVKLLRVLQEKTFERVGGERSITVNVRVVAATNRDLKTEIKEGRFREDLFYRLNIVNIHIPPLRERKEDIPLMSSAFLSELAQENGKIIEGIDSKAKMALYNYNWPGNVRELRNSIESAIVMARTKFITIEDLPPSVRTEDDGQYIRLDVGITMDQAEKEIIKHTLLSLRGNKSKTAEVLGIGRKTLHRKITEYGIE
jgi:DNA-binding NtrC family response regulator